MTRAQSLRCWSTLVLAFAATTLGCGSADAEPDAGTPRVESAAGEAFDAGEPDAGERDAGSTDASMLDGDVLDGDVLDGDVLGDAAIEDAALDAPPDPRLALQAQIERVRADITALEALISGTLPRDFDTQQLFEVDLLAPQAVATRAAELRARIGAAAAAPEGEADAGVVLTAPLDAGTALAAPPDDGGMPDAGVPDAGPSAEALEALLDGLRLERDRLRLSFLELAEDQRVVVLAAERERRRIASEREAADARAARAAENARRAEEARREALERAEASASAVQRELLSERARVESARAELATSEGDLADQRSEFATSDAEALELVHEIEQWLVTEGSQSEADALYDQSVAELIGVRRAFAVSLNELERPSRIPDFELALPPADRLAAFPDDVRDLRAAAADLDAQIDILRTEEAALRDERASRLGEHLRTLNALRIRLLPAMSVARREAVLGLGPEGIGQLVRELEHVWLVARLWWWEVRRDAPEAPRAVIALLGRESSRNTLLFFVLELALIATLITRRARVSSAIEAWILRAAEERRARKLVLPWASAASGIALALAVLLLLALALDHLDALFARAEIGALRLVVLGYAGYRASCELIGSSVAMRVAARQDGDAALLEQKGRRSSSLVLRFAFGAAILLALSERVLGRGYLYAVVSDVMAWGALPLFAILIFWWRAEIQRVYPVRYPASRLAPWLAPERGRVVRYLASFPAGLRLSGLLVFEAAADVALRFDQSRRAAAFLMRRRLEQQTTEEMPAKVDLPDELIEAFTPEPVDDARTVDLYPGMKPILATLRAWKDDPEAPGISVAVVGERGAGKTSWAQALFRKAEIDAVYVDAPRGLRTYDDACVFLSDALGIERQHTVDALVECVARRGLRRAVHIDHCQNLVLRAIGGTEAIRALAQVAGRTSGSVVWVCSFSRYTWLYLRRARQSENLFQQLVELGRWPEEALGELIRRRMQAAGYAASFADLGDEQGGARTKKDEERNEDRFLRMLWDDSEGNPRVAMAFWLRALVPDGDHRMRVRYYQSPQLTRLDRLEEQSRFMLAAIIIHENLSTEAAAATLGVHPRTAASLLSFLSSEGLIEVGPEGHFRVRTIWYRAAIAFLRRQRLLFT